jgi:alpha-glucosidase
VLNFYRALLAFRRSYKPLSKGTIELVEAPAGILAFTRSAGNETLFCAFNMTEAEIVFALPAGISPTDIGAPGVTASPRDGALSLPPFNGYIGSLN